MKQTAPNIVVASSIPHEGRLISRHLRKNGYHAKKTHDGHSCLRLLKEKPDLLLLDLSLKGANQILKRARKREKIPILAFDHKRNPLKEIKAIHQGVDGYLGRPCLKEELLSAIRPFLELGNIHKHYEGLLKEEACKRSELEKVKSVLGSELKRITDFSDKIASNVPLSIIIVDQETRVTYVNRNFCRAMGWNPEELKSLMLSEIFPEQLYGPIGLIEKVESVLHRGGPTPRFSMGYRGVSYTCRVLPIAFRRKREGWEGGSSRQAMILIENISELKTLGERVKISEEKYRTLFEGSPDGFVVAHPGGGRIVDLNRQAERLLGYSRGDLKKRSLIYLFPKGARKRAREKMQFLKGPVDLPDLLIPLGRKKGRNLTVIVSPIHHMGEEAILCILKDVTEKRFLEEQVRHSEKMSLLGQFTAGAAHEINNPLAIISSHSQFLLSQLNGGKIKRKQVDEIRDTLNLIDRESRYCGGIIKNLLGYTHAPEVVKKPVDLGEVARDTLKMVEHQLSLSNLEVKTEFPSKPVIVPGDTNLLQQVLMNLIWNAQGAMPKGGEIQITVEQGENGFAKVSVTDSGIGIDKDKIEDIFTPFFTTKEVGKGTGLGLWVVRSIIDEHKGKIDVKSQKGKGTVFTVSLPAVQGEASQIRKSA